MMRLIDFDALKEKEQYIPCGNGLLFHGVTAATIDAMPVVDARPVVHAKWEYGGDDFDDSTWRCSACCEPWTLIVGTPEENNMKFCPNCGAQMDGGTDNG